MPEALARSWKEVVTSFLEVGATAYGGPAMGIMQAEFQEHRQWVTKPRFLEGLALVNVLPGATATQLAIFLGYVRAGCWGDFWRDSASRRRPSSSCWRSRSRIARSE